MDINTKLTSGDSKSEPISIHIFKRRLRRLEREKALETARMKRDAIPDPKTGNPVIDSLNMNDLIARPEYGQNVRFRAAYTQRRRALAHLDAAEATEKLRALRQARKRAREARRLEIRGKIMTESKTLGDMTTGAPDNTETLQNLVEHSGEVPEEYSSGVTQHSVQDGGKTQLSLDKFFERPISIYDGTWATDVEQNVILEAWNLWSLDASVRAKLSNYSYFRGTLNLKIAITGTPYHYGRVMCSYQPYANFNNILKSYDILLNATIPQPAGVYPMYKTYTSQAPGVAYIDIKENQPAEVKIPFISHKPKFRLFNESNTVITNATELTDFKEAGEMRLITLNKPAIANDDFDSEISVNVYAWVTDVQLGNTTSTDMNITAQSKEVEEPKISPMYNGDGNFGSRLMQSLEKGGADEYSEPGPVTKIASSVAAAGAAMSSVPYIGPFAKATSTIAGAAGAIASYFGWSKPALITDPYFVKNVPFQNGATTIGKETAYKLTLDPKQELTVDQSLGGCSEDQMTIAHLAQRESFLTSFSWDDTQVALTTVLWKCLVSPYLFSGNVWTPVATEQRFLQPTSMMFAAQPFDAWRGTVRYRFEIVCSRFHRGKLVFKFEPNVAMNGLITSNNSKLNQQNMIILDIQDSQELTFDVNWAAPRNWADSPHDFDPSNLPYGTPLAANTNFDFTASTASNGFVEVRALNELVQPTPTSSLKINVYVSCPDLQVNRFTEDQMPVSREVIWAESKTVEPINSTDAAITDSIFLDHFGERIFSFRSLMKRYVTSGIGFKNISISGPGVVMVTGTLYPDMGLPTGSSPPSSSYPRHLFNYLRHGYLGVRGGMRHRITPITNVGISNSDYTRIAQSVNAALNHNAIIVDADVVNGLSDIVGLDLAATLDGSILAHHATNGGVEFEMPFYSQDLWLFCQDTAWGTGITLESTAYIGGMNWNWKCNFSSTLASGDSAAVTVDSATAEDFTFLRFQGAPFFTEANQFESATLEDLPDWAVQAYTSSTSMKLIGERPMLSDSKGRHNDVQSHV